MSVIYVTDTEDEYNEQQYVLEHTPPVHGISELDIFQRFEKNRFKLLVVSAIPVFLVPVTSTSYLPAYPLIEEEFRVSNFAIVLTLASYTLFTGIMPLFYGPMADRFGRKLLIMSTLIAFFGASLLAGSSINIYILILGRALMAICNGGLVIFSTAVVADVFPPKMRGGALGFSMIPAMIGPIVGPPLGGLLVETLGWRSVFYMLNVMILLILPFIFVVLPETNHNIIRKKEEDLHYANNPQYEENDESPSFINPKVVHSNPIKFLLNPMLLIANIANGLSFAAVYNMISLFPGLMAKYHFLGSLDQGLLLVVFGIGTVFGSVVGGRLSDILKNKIGVGAILLASVVLILLVSLSITLFGWLIPHSIFWPTLLAGTSGFFGMANRNCIVAFTIANCPTTASAAATAIVLFIQFTFVVGELLISPLLINAFDIGWAMTIFASLLVAAVPFLIIPIRSLYHHKESFHHVVSANLDHQRGDSFNEEGEAPKQIEKKTDF